MNRTKQALEEPVGSLKTFLSPNTNEVRRHNPQQSLYTASTGLRPEYCQAPIRKNQLIS